MSLSVWRKAYFDILNRLDVDHDGNRQTLLDRRTNEWTSTWLKF